ncbi:MAG TPA: hypothetical protein HA230_02380 [Candidatus Aenigmarchaeota archaeon]|nr:hypothetical protein [Candidatus Aenigmarchaeota archaeon]
MPEYICAGCEKPIKEPDGGIRAIGTDLYFHREQFSASIINPENGNSNLGAHTGCITASMPLGIWLTFH